METDAVSLSVLLRTISASIGYAEQELKKGIVNTMSMHKARGLSSDVVFIVGAFIPGKNIGLKAEDERRLFYVFLTRAKHSLFITCCKSGTKEQRYLGSESGKVKREITPFLKDSILRPEDIP